jgi:hypothetical protein
MFTFALSVSKRQAVVSRIQVEPGAHQNDSVKMAVVVFHCGGEAHSLRHNLRQRGGGSLASSGKRPFSESDSGGAFSREKRLSSWFGPRFTLNQYKAAGDFVMSKTP